jgi:tetratricopeptide (TPR) repeat protein
MRRLGIVLWCAACVSMTPLASWAEIKPEEQALVTGLMSRMSAVIHPANMTWPPQIDLQDGPLDAYAQLDDSKKPAVPHVVITTGLLRDVIEGVPDRLAFVVGHEIGHHVLGHTAHPAPGSSSTHFLRATYSRDDEFAADLYGMQWMLNAGYSYRAGLSAFKLMQERGIAAYSPFEGLSSDHPSWAERIAALDKEQPTLWRAMGAFDSGVYLLDAEQYAMAERCFRGVVKQFPDSYDAWANLGYALLMQYADKLEVADLRRFGVGQVVVGGFYRRPGSLEAQVRGIDEAMWQEATEALKTALRLRPDSALASANLGVAYLIRPAGKDTGRAIEWLEKAKAAAARDAAADPVARASVQINLGVAYLAAGDTAAFNRELAAADGAVPADAPRRGGAASLASAAIVYNRALLSLSSSDVKQRRRALAGFEAYLGGVGSDSAWWTLAYEQYVGVCKELGVAPKSRQEMEGGKRSQYRPVMSMTFGPGKRVELGQATREATANLGPSQPLPAVDGGSLVRYVYPALGTELLANDRVIAISLSGASSPAISLRSVGLSGKQSSLRIGMSKDELEAALADVDFDFGQLLDPDKDYRFYGSLGLAVKLQSGSVVELVIVQIPRVG